MNTRKLSMLLAIAAVTACQSRQTASSADSAGSSPDSSKLVVGLSTAQVPASKDSLILTFTVSNHADTIRHFLKWSTPFEPLLGKYLSVTNKDGIEAQYKGPMAKRMMPPPAESYIAVNPHDSVSATFNLIKGYSVVPGQYTIKYTASGISGLIPENEIKVNVPAK